MKRSEIKIKRGVRHQPRFSRSCSTRTNSTLKWKDFNGHRDYLSKLLPELGVKPPGILLMYCYSSHVPSAEEWYKVNLESVKYKIEKGVLHRYNGSVVNILLDFYPNYDWKIWKFGGNVPKHFWESKDNRRAALEHVGEELGIQSLEDWYKVKAKDVKYGVLAYYQGSLITALMDIYPDYAWQEWRFPSVSKGYWDNVHNHRKYFDWLSVTLGIEVQSDWYAVRWTDIVQEGATGLLEIYKNTLHKALANVYPQFLWSYWKFNHARLDKLSHTHILDSIAQDIGVHSFDDWYQVTAEDFKQNGAGSLLENFYENSVVHAVTSCYPFVSWQLFRFADIHPSYWTDQNNHVQLLDWIGEELGVRDFEDWYSIDSSEVKKQRGAEYLLANYYRGSLSNALRSCYPMYPWNLIHFKRVAHHHWKSLHNQRVLFDWLAKELNLESKEDWYQVKLSELKKATHVLRLYKGSLYKALSAVYPQFPWQPWKFQSNVGNSIWKDLDIARQYIEYMSQELGIKELSEWYDVSPRQLNHALLKTHKGLLPLLQKLYPEFPWQQQDISLPILLKAQRRLFKCLQQLFPNMEILQEFSAPNITFQNTDWKMKFDVYIPALSLVFEHQGRQHYSEPYWMFGNDEIHQRDSHKKDTLRSLGKTLIEIPFWWDWTKESLAATIHQHRPDLLAEYSMNSPIPLEFPKELAYSKQLQMSSFEELSTAQEWS